MKLVDPEWWKDAICVFDGASTCCTRKHVGCMKCDRVTVVKPLLGLYAQLYAMSKSDGFKSPVFDEVTNW